MTPREVTSPVAKQKIVSVSDVLSNTAHTVNLVYNHLMPDRNISKAKKMGVILGSNHAT